MLKKQVGIALLMVVSVAVMGCSSEKSDETANLQSALQPIVDVRKAKIPLLSVCLKGT